MDTEALRDKVIEAIKTVYDPEIPVDVWELGLIYDVEITDDSKVFINMTLTAPSCPSAQEIPLEVDQKVRSVEGVEDVAVNVVWDPAWDRSMMSETALVELGFM
ncbi:MAG TPA: SUF system Fe-S cluster assembly protein [Ginsengibacter sp.]|nr:SUF system Fe-S cluster assembly protein [Chitinophagaceae bacterium]HRN71898.1 SUF system Fe-S cluster assembly protein [Ginsengibacter sp.]HRP16738.1 SUF system Fe-S cluster assembly protein [Ginsengibacter sp.]